MTATVEYYANHVQKYILQQRGEREYWSWFAEEEYLKHFDPAELEYRSWGEA